MNAKTIKLIRWYCRNELKDPTKARNKAVGRWYQEADVKQKSKFQRHVRSKQMMARISTEVNAAIASGNIASLVGKSF